MFEWDDNNEENSSSNIINVYHGSPNQYFKPTFGLGQDKHDYGRGFYVTENLELAKEWATLGQRQGYLHKYSLDLTNLKILDFEQLNVYNWLAELLYHRPASNGFAYKKRSEIFIQKFKIDTSGYDIIKGYRADASYFSIAKRYIRAEIDTDLLDELLRVGELGIQLCIKSEKAYENLIEVEEPYLVDSDYINRYIKRDTEARNLMENVIRSERNTLTNTIDKILFE